MPETTNENIQNQETDVKLISKEGGESAPKRRLEEIRASVGEKVGHVRELLKLARPSSQEDQEFASLGAALDKLDIDSARSLKLSKIETVSIPLEERMNTPIPQDAHAALRQLAQEDDDEISSQETTPLPQGSQREKSDYEIALEHRRAFSDKIQDIAYNNKQPLAGDADMEIRTEALQYLEDHPEHLAHSLANEEYQGGAIQDIDNALHMLQINKNTKDHPELEERFKKVISGTVLEHLDDLANTKERFYMHQSVHVVSEALLAKDAPPTQQEIDFILNNFSEGLAYDYTGMRSADTIVNLLHITEDTDKVNEMLKQAASDPDDKIRERGVKAIAFALNTIQAKEGPLEPNEVDFMFREGIKVDETGEKSAKAIVSLLRATKDTERAEQVIDMIKQSVGSSDHEIRDNTLRAISKVYFTDGDYKQYTSEQVSELMKYDTLLRDEIERPMIEALGYDYDQLLESWRDGGGRKVDHKNIDHPKNIITMLNLEANSKGICEKLKDEYGISNFGRYPQEMLQDMYDNLGKTDLPYGIILYPKNDHNGAFYQNQDVLKKMYDQTKALGYRIRIGEVGTVGEIARTLLKFDTQYNANGDDQIQFALVGGHGNGEQITFGEMNDTNASLKKLDFEEYTDTEVSGDQAKKKSVPGAGVRRAGKRFFASGATIMFNSCTSGKAEGLAESVSTANEGMFITGQSVPANIKDIDVHTENGKLSFNVEYYKGESNTYMKSTSSEAA